MDFSGKKTEAGPFPGSDENQLTFIAEQVSVIIFLLLICLGESSSPSFGILRRASGKANLIPCSYLYEIFISWIIYRCSFDLLQYVKYCRCG